LTALADVLAPGIPIREVEPGLFSVLAVGDEGAAYDTRAAAYDRLVSSRWYSQLAWGVEPAVHTDFITRALTSAPEGWALDVAAGSCVPSAAAYPKTARPVVVLDRSLVMLRRGMARVREVHGRVPPRLCFLQADATALPFRAEAFASVLCHGALHVFPSPEPVCNEWKRVLARDGSLHVSSLVRGRWLGDRYLALLHRAGEIAQPRTPGEVAALVEAALGAPAQVSVIGNFAYLSLRAALRA
jgi:ubiquinone/menaquinone biosynthesis C-methylase UbiE